MNEYLDNNLQDIGVLYSVDIMQLRKLDEFSDAIMRAYENHLGDAFEGLEHISPETKLVRVVPDGTWYPASRDCELMASASVSFTGVRYVPASLKQETILPKDLR